MAIINNKWIQYYVPITLVLFSCITKERIVDTDGGYDRLYGFPFGYISNNFSSTGHYDVYIGALAVDLFFYLFITWIAIRIVEKATITFKTYRILSILGIFFILFWALLFYMTTFESSFKLSNDIPSKTLSYRFVFNHLL